MRMYGASQQSHPHAWRLKACLEDHQKAECDQSGYLCKGFGHELALCMVTMHVTSVRLSFKGHSAGALA